MKKISYIAYAKEYCTVSGQLECQNGRHSWNTFKM